MLNQSNLLIKENDYIKISALVASATEDIQEFLQTELDRAVVVPDHELPQEVVAMSSRVVFRDIKTQKESIVKLVYPSDASISESKISILAPLGAALIGLRVGQTIRWPLPGGQEREIQVMRVEKEI